MVKVTTNWNKVSFEVLQLLNKKFKLKMTKTEIKNTNIYIFFFFYKTYVIVIFKNVNNNVLFIAFYYVCACKLH